LKTKEYYLVRATFLRDMARESATEKLREGCLKMAALLEEQAEQAPEGPIKTES